MLVYKFFRERFSVFILRRNSIYLFFKRTLYFYKKLIFEIWREVIISLSLHKFASYFFSSPIIEEENASTLFLVNIFLSRKRKKIERKLYVSNRVQNYVRNLKMKTILFSWNQSRKFEKKNGISNHCHWPKKTKLSHNNIIKMSWKNMHGNFHERNCSYNKRQS